MAADLASACSGVVKRYATDAGTVYALRGVDAEFPDGAVTALVGASGSGKSTLLRLLAGLERPTEGVVEVGRVEVSGLGRKALRGVRRDLVGYVFQRPSDNFVPHLTVEEHLALGGGGPPYGTDDLLDLLGLSAHRDRLPSALSGGEQQRAAFAQVVLSGARLVVADEPTAELDAESSARLLESVRTLAERGVAVVLATHDQAVRAIADGEVELEHGRNRRPEEPRHREAREALDARRISARGARGEIVARAESVSRSFHHAGEDVRALDGVSLDVRAGALTALVGRSGSGKTTLLNLLAGWETPDAGRAEVPGTAWADVAVLPQRFGLLAELTVRENVEYPLRLAGRDGRVDELLDALGLTELADRFPHETSIGQQQRAALCRALVIEPRLVLADEPTGHQDAGSALAVAGALRDAAERGSACLVATHDEELAGLCDVAVSLEGGRLARPPSA